MAGELRFPRINHVILSARLTQDPELRYTPSGSPVANLRLAFNRVYKDSSGEFREVPGFIDAVVWGRQADQCASKLKKGSPLIVEGSIQTRSYENKEGRNVKVVEINAFRVHFLEWTEGSRGGDDARVRDDDAGDRDTSDEKPDVTDDDVPF